MPCIGGGRSALAANGTVNASLETIEILSDYSAL
jgi:hypothetical protein